MNDDSDGVPSPLSDDSDAAPLFDAAPPASRAPRRRWPWALLALVVAVPLLLTLAGVVTAPPRAAFVPAGRIVFLEADQPSEHTSLLRGLRITTAGSNQSHEVLHETEPQDVDAGSRDWLAQPAASPDGHWLVYEKQLITLQEERTGIVNQLWVLPLDAPRGKPHLLADLTARRLKQPIGLAWTADSMSVVFLEDSAQYTVNAQGTPRLTAAPLLHLPPLRATPSLSATRHPVVYAQHLLALDAQTPQGCQFLVLARPNSRRFLAPRPVASVWAAQPNGTLARAAALDGHDILIGPDFGLQASPAVLRARWGWSVFGGRRITSLKWSPDGRYLGYTVSKPPFEDELFYADTVSGKCYQLPIRTGRAAWDWTR